MGTMSAIPLLELMSRYVHDIPTDPLFLLTFETGAALDAAALLCSRPLPRNCGEDDESFRKRLIESERSLIGEI